MEILAQSGHYTIERDCSEYFHLYESDYEMGAFSRLDALHLQAVFNRFLYKETCPESYVGYDAGDIVMQVFPAAQDYLIERKSDNTYGVQLNLLNDEEAMQIYSMLDDHLTSRGLL